uniref:F-box domain-containing protein n=1 Tax=Leersia perrieri TaxID=77586 RepID=A0A0D9WEI0_9ORYZ
MTTPLSVSDGGDASQVLFTGIRDHADLLIEVLLRLPPWSLCQLRCVCKLWLERTTSSIFLSAYADRHASNPSNWFLLDKTIFIDTAPTPRGPMRALLRKSEPPKVSSIIVSSRLCPIRQKGFWLDQSPMVISYSGGLILLSGNDNNYYVCNPFTGDTFLLSVPKPQLRNAESLGIVARDGDYVVAELVTACLRCFSSVNGHWEKSVVCPEFSKSDMVFSSGRMLHWVDLKHGILSCDPFASAPTVLFINLPEANARPSRGLDEWFAHEDDGESGSMSLWALGGNSGEWVLEYKMGFEDLSEHESYDDYSLEGEVPLVGLVDPLNEQSLRKETSNSDSQEAGSSGKPQKSAKGRRRKSKT